MANNDSYTWKPFLKSTKIPPHSTSLTQPEKNTNTTHWRPQHSNPPTNLIMKPTRNSIAPSLSTTKPCSQTHQPIKKYKPINPNNDQTFPWETNTTNPQATPNRSSLVLWCRSLPTRLPNPPSIRRRLLNVGIYQWNLGYVLSLNLRFAKLGINWKKSFVEWLGP